MNIEELELSLRTEFEGQIRNVLAGVKKDVAAFQKKFEAEFEKHRSELDRTISELSEKLPETSATDAAFLESVGEHLRLARDDGAQVAATAFGEAEKLKVESERTENFNVMRDAIADISSKSSQATILQALVDGAARFCSRGAFFIVKNDHIVGWKVFGSNAPMDDGRVREVHFPASDDTVLSAAIRTMSMASASNGEYSGDRAFLEMLNFGSVENSYAIPLTARGRGVAVLYADAGHGGKVNVEALETLVRVAGLTVELLAASQSAHVPVAQPAEPVAEMASGSAEAQRIEDAPAQEVEESQNVAAEEYVEPVAEPEAAHEPMAEAVNEAEPEPTEVETEYTGEVSYEVEAEPGSFESPTFAEEPMVGSYQPVVEDEPQQEADVEVSEPIAEEMPEVAEFESFQPSGEPVTEEAQTEVQDSRFEMGSSASFDSSYQEETVEHETFAEESVPLVESPVAEVPVALNGNGKGHSTQVADPVVEVAAVQPTKSRLSDRNVDLPIEVADDERRLHNDARRFARLLVSEIKLYNEQKVTEGREANDLYDRLREAIDRSREMYDKRVQPAVASKFDYFHYELVNSLAEGVEDKLGANYSGASV